MTAIVRYVFLDLLRTRFAVAYTLFLGLCTVALFQLDSDTTKVMLSVLNIVLMIVPLFSIVFATIHYYNSYEFISLLLAQPIHRRTLFMSEFLGVSSTLSCSFAIGVGVPALLYGAVAALAPLLLTGIALTFTFVALAFLASVVTQDKARAIGISLLFWIYFAMIYDGLLLLMVFTFSDYPLEKVTLALIALNPIDLARIVMIMQMDVSALMGYTGAFYKEFFGGIGGILFSSLMLVLWTLAPMLAARKIFSKKDL